MTNRVWASHIRDIGESSPADDGKPISQMVEFRLCANFAPDAAMVERLRNHACMELIRPVGTTRRVFRVIVRWLDVPAEHDSMDKLVSYLHSAMLG
jgi:hypothetical protein